MDPLSPVLSDEFILRRVPEMQLLRDSELHLVTKEAFAPASPRPKEGRKGDVDGLSVYRELFHSVEEVACVLRVSGTRPCYVARLLASDLYALGLTIDPDPKEASEHPNNIAQPGHSVIPELRVDTAKSDEAIQFMESLARLVTPGKLCGPFEPPA